MAENTDSEFKFEILRPPVPTAICEEVISCLSTEMDQPWLTDIRIRLNSSSEESCDLFVVSRDSTGRVVSNVWIGWNGRQSEGKRVGLLGHVVTLNSHRGKGLATKVTELAISEFYTLGGVCLVLGVSNPSAYRIYFRAGFRPVKKGSDEYEFIMFHYRHSSEPDLFLSEYFSKTDDAVTLETVTRHNVGDIGLLFISFPSNEINCGDVIKLGDGMSAELDALKLFLLVDEGKVTSHVLVSNYRVIGLEVQASGTKYSITHPLFQPSSHIAESN